MEKTEAHNAIEIEDLRIDYGEKVAVDGLTLSIAQGEIFGLLGPNGAGKSSTFRVLATLQAPTYGDVRICGVDIAEQPENVRHQLGYMPDLAPVPTDLKVWEFLDMFAAAHGMPSSIRLNRIDECLKAVHLEDSWHTYCKTLSRGMTQRVVLARNLLHRPRVLILDEPASGMDPFSRAALRTTLQELAATGTTIVISSHILRELSDLCTGVGILHEGKLVANGTVREVIHQLSSQGTTLHIRVKTNESQARQTLTNHKSAGEISTIDGELQFPFAGDEDEQIKLLNTLVTEGCTVASFYPETATMEEVLLNLSSLNQAATSS